MEIPTVALGAILGAIIAALASFLGLIISKENKVSEFRHAWIEALRSDFVILLSHLSHIRMNHSEYEKEDVWENTKSHYLELDRATNGIILRLNPKEKSSQEIFNRIVELQKVFGTGDPPREKFLELYNGFLPEIQAVLKAEWKRVRRGELVFRVVKGACFSIIFLGVAALVYQAAF